MGVRKLPLRQTAGKSAEIVYQMLKGDRIIIVKVVRRDGKLNSRYLFYLDHSPKSIIHLGIVYDGKTWHPESLLVTQNRSITCFIGGQQPVDILHMLIE